jgi:hypothetical protein
MELIKELAGVDPDADLNEYVNKETEIEVYRLRMDLLAGHTLSDFSGGVELERWQDAFGFNAFETSQEIWAESLLQPNITRPLFSVMKGDFDTTNIIEKFNGLGYQRKTYESIDYYSINEDYQVGDARNSEEARLAMFFLNRIMVTDQEIIAAPADDVFFSALDARLSEQSSLKDSPTYTRVAHALTGGVLGAALIPQSILRSENVGADWGILNTYDLVGIGYLVEGQNRKIMLALHYPDNSAADDIDELNHRMAEYEVTNGVPKPSLLFDLFEIGKPEATTYGPDSILKVELVYKPDTPSTLWSALVESQDLGFLVVNR